MYIVTRVSAFGKVTQTAATCFADAVSTCKMPCKLSAILLHLIGLRGKSHIVRAGRDGMFLIRNDGEQKLSGIDALASDAPVFLLKAEIGRTMLHAVVGSQAEVAGAAADLMKVYGKARLVAVNEIGFAGAYLTDGHGKRLERITNAGGSHAEFTEVGKYCAKMLRKG